MSEQKRLLLEMTDDQGRITLIPFDPNDVLHEVHGISGEVFRYTVQDLIDQCCGTRYLPESG